MNGYDKRNIDIKVNGNKSSFEMLIPLGLQCSKVRAISFPWTNMTGDVARARASFMSGASFLVSGNTDDLRELVRDSDNYRVKVLFKIPYLSSNITTSRYGRGTNESTTRHVTTPTAEILKIEIIKANEDKKNTGEERKVTLIAVDLKEELKKSGFDSLRDFAYFGTAELKDKFDKADAFDKPTVEAEIKSKKVDIARKTFVAEYDYSIASVRVDGNKSSFLMSTTFELPGFSSPRVETAVFTAVFPVPDITGDVAKIQIRPARDNTHVSHDAATLILPVNGNTDSVRELVRNNNNYRAKVHFKIQYIVNSPGPIRGVQRPDGTGTPFIELQKIEIVKVK